MLTASLVCKNAPVARAGGGDPWEEERFGSRSALLQGRRGQDFQDLKIDQAHKHGLKTIAHIYTLEDAKGVLRAGIDYFAHSVRDRNIDDEFVNMMKARPNIIVDPNLPDRGVKVDRSWLRESVILAEFEKLQAESKDDPKAQQFFGIQSRNLARLNAAGIKIALGTDGPIPWAGHEEMADMVASGMTPAQVIVAATCNAAELLKVTDAGTVAPARAQTSL